MITHVDHDGQQYVEKHDIDDNDEEDVVEVRTLRTGVQHSFPIKIAYGCRVVSCREGELVTLSFYIKFTQDARSAQA